MTKQQHKAHNADYGVFFGHKSSPIRRGVGGQLYSVRKYLL